MWVCMVFGIISRTKARSAINEVPNCRSPDKVGIPNFVSGPREYIMEGEYVILAMCSWFRIS